MQAIRDAHSELVMGGALVRWVLPPKWPRSTAQQAEVADNRDRTAANILAAGVPLMSRSRARIVPADLRDYAHLNDQGAKTFVQSFAPSKLKTAVKLTLGAGVLVALHTAVSS